jgi:amino acid transporter
LPRRGLSTADIAFLIVGIVVGAGIFRVPADVAGAVDSPAAVMGLWLAGGLVALCGALSYAELATRFPSIGGEYHFLKLAWGRRLGALFVWARAAVMQTGAIATVAFVGGDHAAAIWPSGPSAGLWAAIAVATITAWNLLGLGAGTLGQRLFVAGELGAIGLVVAAGAWVALAEIAIPLPTAPPSSGGPGIGLALVFIMLAYGGWNEAAYLSAEARDGGLGLVRALLLGLLLVVVLYLAVNAAFLSALGLEGLAATPAPATLLGEAAFGPLAGAVIGVAVVAAVLSTMNATVITGARAMCAAGSDVPLLRPLGRWDAARSVPRAALVVQGAIALALTGYGATARDGFTAMVAFGAPVFWLFLALTALALFRLRRTHPEATGFRVPLYPLVPLVFLAASVFMLWSSLDYARFLLGASDGGRFAGVAGALLLLAGIPIIWRAGAAAAAR